MSRGATPVEHEMFESQRFMRKKSHSVCHRHRDVSPLFFLIFHHKRELRSGEHETRNGEKEKPLVTLDFNLFWVRTWSSSSGSLIFLQTRKSIRLVRLTGNTEGTAGIFVPALLGKQFCLQNAAVLSLIYKRSRFVCVLHSFCFWQCLRRNLTSVLVGRFPEIESLNEHQSLARSHKSQRFVRQSANRT